jgi:hypothetical protein
MLSLRIYIDDDLAGPLLATLLRRAGHDAVLPSSLGLTGETDPVHLTNAICERRVLLSGNHDDFEELHALILASSGHHPGILVVRSDNDRRRDLKPPGIVGAIRNFCDADVPLDDAFYVLNHWR